ncbi:hypothetical protein H6G41_29855 [Tolypothrix sp. FACHB-123]|uniref:plasmid partition protein ParG n=1 Tax=Tolypothrix sp. FACHB-123 TaxID=2692868 RepID=UPI0016884CD5|nr:hypothetical protein [Calothrix membranacea FACHB-236]MBD2358752.1 hypothetical protein [Tolypothrix sp. FACHB-123]
MANESKDKIFFRTRIDALIHKRFKKLCVDEDVTMESVVNKLIEDWVKHKEAESEKK